MKWILSERYFRQRDRSTCSKRDLPHKTMRPIFRIKPARLSRRPAKWQGTMRSVAIVIPLGFVLLPIVGCAHTQADRQPYEATDSSGIRVIDSYGPAWPSGHAWTVNQDPRITLGSIDGVEQPQLFSRVQGATRLPNGNIAVLDEQTRELRIFDSKGEHLTTVGGSGEGPGEFSEPRTLTSHGDTLQVDAGLRRVRFDANGHFLADERMDWSNLPRPGLACPLPRFIGDDVVTCDYPRSARSDPEALMRVQVRMLHSRWGHPAVDTIGVFESMEFFFHYEGHQPQQITHPLSPQGVFAVSERQQRFLYAITHTYELREYDFGGQLMRILRRHNAMHALNPDDIAAGFQEGAAQLSGLSPSSAAKRLELPDSIAPFSEILYGKGGEIWVALTDRTGRPNSDYEVFGREGWLLGTVAVPAGVRILEVGQDYILALRMNDLDVPFVELYDLQRGE